MTSSVRPRLTVPNIPTFKQTDVEDPFATLSANVNLDVSPAEAEGVKIAQPTKFDIDGRMWKFSGRGAISAEVSSPKTFGTIQLEMLADDGGRGIR